MAPNIGQDHIFLRGIVRNLHKENQDIRFSHQEIDYSKGFKRYSGIIHHQAQHCLKTDIVWNDFGANPCNHESFEPEGKGYQGFL